MAHLLLILALSTKVMTNGRMKKVLKRLAGKMDVEDALEKLAMLTKEEISMTMARNLKVAHDVDGNVLQGMFQDCKHEESLDVQVEFGRAAVQ